MTRGSRLGLPVDPDVDLRHDLPPGGGAEPRVGPERSILDWPVLAVIGLGGGLGSVARQLIERAWPPAPGAFPWSTFGVNVSGSLLLGFLLVLVLRVWPPTRFVRPFAAVGFLAGFTTFSTFVAEIRALLARGSWPVADGYAIGSVLVGLVAVWVGMTAARQFGRPVDEPAAPPVVQPTVVAKDGDR